MCRPMQSVTSITVFLFTVCCINVPVVPGMISHVQVKWGVRFSEKDPYQAWWLQSHCFSPCQSGWSPSCSPLCQILLFTGEKVAVLGWAEESGSSCHHSPDMLGIRRSHQYLEGCFALGGNFELPSLHSRHHNFCWSWKINLKSSEFQPEELATLLEGPLHALNLSIKLSYQIFANSCFSNKSCLLCGLLYWAVNHILRVSQVVFTA